MTRAPATPHRRASLIGAMILCVAACGASTGPSASVSGPASPAASPSVAPPVSVAPSVSAEPSPTEQVSATPSNVAIGKLCANNSDPCDLAAGTYSTAPFEPAFTFAIDAGWTNARAWPDGGEIGRPIGVVQWASGVHLGFMKGIAGPSTEIGPTTSDFIAFLRKFKGFTVSQPTPVTVDGVDGQQVDVLTNRLAVRGLFAIIHDAYNVDAGEKIRFLVLDKAGKTVILIVDAFKAEQFDAFATEARPVIDSVAWLP